jgi:hypothetical protein
MRSRFHRFSLKLASAFLAAILLSNFGPPALRTIEQVDFVLVQISLEVCHVGLAVWRACGI